MKKIKRIITAVLAAGMLFGISASAAVTVNLNSVVYGGVTPMVFDGDAAPVVINDTTMVPARTIANNIGMQVEWDESTQTAILSMDAQPGYTLISQFVAEQINKASGYGGLDLTPKCISASFSVGSLDSILRYVFCDSEGDEVCLGKTVSLSQAPVMTQGSTLMLPLRDTVMMFGMQTSWDEQSGAVEITLPDSVVAPKGLKIVPSYTYGVQENTVTASGTVYTQTVEEDSPVPQDTSKGTYLGRFKITHYCPCSICNGGYNGTAWAGSIIPGQTIAVDPSIIPKLSWVYIDGYGLRRAEDCGGAIKGYHIDMAVSSHAEAYRLGVVYEDVWLQ